MCACVYHAQGKVRHLPKNLTPSARGRDHTFPSADSRPHNLLVLVRWGIQCCPVISENSPMVHPKSWLAAPPAWLTQSKPLASAQVMLLTFCLYIPLQPPPPRAQGCPEQPLQLSKPLLPCLEYGSSPLLLVLLRVTPASHLGCRPRGETTAPNPGPPWARRKCGSTHAQHPAPPQGQLRPQEEHAVPGVLPRGASPSLLTHAHLGL